MGSQNIRACYTHWTQLPPRSFMLLGFMALVTRDDDDPPTYFGQREGLCAALGRKTPDEPPAADQSPEATAIRKQRIADFQAVKTAMQPLLKNGAVSVLRPSAPGRNAVYALHLDTATGYGSRTGRGTEVVRTGYAGPTPSGTGNVPAVGGFGGETYNQTQHQEALNPGTKSPQVTNSPAPVDNTAKTRNGNGETGIPSLTYPDAQSILASLPDLGATLLQKTPDGLGMAERVILAAMNHLTKDRETA